MPTFNEMSKMTVKSDSGKIELSGNDIVDLFNATQKTKEVKERWYSSGVEKDEKGRAKQVLVPLTDYLNPEKKNNQLAIQLGKLFDEKILKNIPFDFSNEFDTSIEFRNFANGQKNRFMREGMPKFDGKLASYKYLSKVSENAGLDNNNIDQNMAKAKVITEMLESIQKSFETYMKNHADTLKPSIKTLEQYRTIYTEALAKIAEKIEKGDYSEWNKKDKDGNVYKKGEKADAERHATNIEKKMAAIDEAIAKTNKKADNAKASMPDEIKNLDVDAVRNKQRLG